MTEKELKIPFSAPLNSGDTEVTTFGCRANNADICKNNGIENVCAFASVDHICKEPSRAWKKRYNDLKSEVKA